MKNTPLLALGLILCTPLGLFAQNFSGSDDFSSDSGYWTDQGSSGGTFTVADGVVSYTDDAALTASGTNDASVLWNQNSGSYIANWSVMFDCTITSAYTPNADESAYWALVLVNSYDSNDYFALVLKKDNANGLYVQGVVDTNGTPVNASSTASIDSGDTATLQVYYEAASNTLSAMYDATGSSDGYSFTNLWSVTVPSEWGMDSSAVFALVVQAAHTTTSTADAITTGTFTADNFVANGAAVPEPSTYALLGGLAVLGFCFWRRRVA